MDIGKEKERILVEPVVEPFERPAEKPEEPVRETEPVREKEPASNRPESGCSKKQVEQPLG